ncbi:unnamed protein product [Closterium sp. Naga37s-1]|nr:unnamed protein product [Closterium sp. Naga37s-1]
MAPRDLPPLTAAPSPLVSAPRDLSPLAAAPVPRRIMEGKGVARGDCGAAVGGRGSAALAPPAPPFSYLPLLRVQQWGGGDLQHQPPPVPPLLLHPWGVTDSGAAVGGRGFAASAPPRPPLLLSLSLPHLVLGGGGSLEVQGEAGGDLRHQPPPAPPTSPPSPCCGCSGGGEGIWSPVCPAALFALHALLPCSPVRPAVLCAPRALQPCAPCCPAALQPCAPCSPARPARSAVLLRV